VTLASSGATNPSAIAVDSTHVYWTNYSDASSTYTNGSVMKALISGGNPASPTLVLGNQTGPSSIGLSNGIYWGTVGGMSNQDGLLWLPVIDTLPFQVGGNSYTHAVGLQLNATNVYWIDSPGPNQDSLLGAPIDDYTTPVTVVAGGSCAVATAIDSTSFYRLQTGCFANSGMLLKSPLSPLGAGTRMVTGTYLASPYSIRIAVANGLVYFGSSLPNLAPSLYTVPTGGAATPTKLVDGAAPNGVAVDANYVYWTDSVANAVMYAPITGGTGKTLAANQSTPYDIVVDSTRVYWTNYSTSGSIVMVAKP
jgi:hypothetical protein